MPMINDETLNWIMDCFFEQLEGLADDPSFLLEAYRDEEPADYFARMRRIAADIGMNFDTVLDKQRPHNIQRVRDIEAGIIQPRPRDTSS